MINKGAKLIGTQIDSAKIEKMLELGFCQLESAPDQPTSVLSGASGGTMPFSPQQLLELLEWNNANTLSLCSARSHAPNRCCGIVIETLGDLFALRRGEVRSLSSFSFLVQDVPNDGRIRGGNWQADMGSVIAAVEILILLRLSSHVLPPAQRIPEYPTLTMCGHSSSTAVCHETVEAAARNSPMDLASGTSWFMP